MAADVPGATFEREEQDRLQMRIRETATRLASRQPDREVSVQAVARKLLQLQEPYPSLAAAEAAVVSALREGWLDCGSGCYRPK